MKNIILSFDYELYLFQPGSVENSLCKPTNEILQVLEENNQVADFFIDTLFLLQLEAIPSCRTDYLRVVSQIQDIVRRGHRVEVHLHPHWLDASFTNNRWKFTTFNRYKLQALTSAEIDTVFRDSFEFLRNIVRTVNPGYVFKAFRAGGWCIQPFSPIKNALLEHGIFIDSSVAPGLREEGVRSFDFTNSPRLSYWSFEDDPLIPCDQGLFVEIPISTCNETVWDRFERRFYQRSTGDVRFGDGVGLGGHRRRVSIPMYFINLLETRRRMFSLEWTRPSKIARLVENSTSDLVVFISHPKALFIKRGLANLKAIKFYPSIHFSDVLETL